MFEQIDILFNEIYDKTYKKTAAYVAGRCGDISDVEDILQETYAELYLVLQKKGPDYVKENEAFIIHVAKSKIRLHYNLKERLGQIVSLFVVSEDGDELPRCELFTENFEISIVNNEMLALIAKELLKFPLLTQKIFYLYYYCDLPINKIAKELSQKESTIKNRLYRTVHKLREIYERSEQV